MHIYKSLEPSDTHKIRHDAATRRLDEGRGITLTCTRFLRANSHLVHPCVRVDESVRLHASSRHLERVRAALRYKPSERPDPQLVKRSRFLPRQYDHLGKNQCASQVAFHWMHGLNLANEAGLHRAHKRQRVRASNATPYMQYSSIIQSEESTITLVKRPQHNTSFCKSDIIFLLSTRAMSVSNVTFECTDVCVSPRALLAR